MATQYTSLLGLALPVTGELSGTWGDTVNDSITSLLDSAVAGTTTLNTDADVTLSTTTGAANQARQAIILWTANGTTTRNITAPAQSKAYVVINKSAGTQSIVFRGVGPTTGVTIAKNEAAIVAWNGSDFIKVSNINGTGTFTDLDVTGTTTLDALTASTALALNASKEIVSVTNTGTGNNVLATSPTLTTPNLGTPSAVTLTNATGLPVSTGISGLGSGVATFLATPSSANLAAAVTDETGSGALVFATSPTLTTPNLGTPSALTLTNATGLPVATGISGLGSGVATFLATPSSANLAATVTDETGTGALVFGTSPTLTTPNISSIVNTGTLTLPTSTDTLVGRATTDTLTNKTINLANNTLTATSAQIAAAVTDETGSGALVFATSPTLTTPNLGTPSAVTLTNATGLPVSTGISGLGSGVATFLATPSSANLAAAVTDETGSGALVFATSPTLTTPAISGGTIDNAVIGGTTRAAGNFTTLNANGNVTLGDASADTITLTGTVQPGVVISGSSSGDALRITQTGSGNALVVEDSANPDSTPFVVDASGRVIEGTTVAVNAVGSVSPQVQLHGVTINTAQEGIYSWSLTPSTTATKTFLKSKSGVVGTYGAVSSNDSLGSLVFAGDDGSAFIEAARISVAVDGTPGTNDMPGRLVFSTTADGASSPTERMRIGNDGGIGIGASNATGYKLLVSGALTGATTYIGVASQGTIQSDVTSAVRLFRSSSATAAASFTIGAIQGYWAGQSTFGVGSTVTSQFGFVADSSLTGAVSNYGFYSNIAAGTGRWNFYANGTAANYFEGATTFNSDLTLNAGTANGVAYLNGSKVLTTGSALTFDGTTLNAPNSVITSSSSSAALRVTQTGSGNALLVEDSANPDATPFVIDAGGRAIIGDTTSTNVPNYAGTQIAVQLQGKSAVAYDGIGLQNYVAGSGSAGLTFAKSRSGTLGTQTVVNDGDNLGATVFAGSDGTAFIRAAQIIAQVDGTPGTNDMPGRLVFSTTADGSATPTERLRISANGLSTFGSQAATGAALSTTAPAKIYTGTGTYTDSSTAASGTVTHGTINAFDNPAIAASNTTVTYSNASTLYIDGAPTAGTNVTITNPYSLFVNSGTVWFGGNVTGTDPVVQQSDIGSAPNEIPLNQYLGAMAYVDTETPALDVGTGITGGTGTICKANGGLMGGIYQMTILIDLTGLNSGGAAGDIIGVNGTANPCYIARLPAMTVLGGRMTCLETPAGGDTDIDLYSAAEGTGVEDQAITALTETEIINAGAQTRGTVTYFSADPAANAYFYLVGQGTANATYTAGRFLIEVFGVL